MKTFFYQKKETLKQKLSFQILKMNQTLQSGLAGVGVVEVILILVVIIGLILIFKSQLTTILNSLFKNIKTSIKSI
jgi:phospholipase/lecithinase/hemolysin